MRTPEQIEELLDKVEALIANVDRANDEYDRDQWHSKYSERLSPLEDKLKALNGDDYDIYKESFDEYHSGYSDLEDDTYIDALVDNIEKLLSKLDSAMHPVEETAEEPIEEEETPEEPIEEEVVEEETPIEDDDSDDFVAELEAYKAKLPESMKPKKD